MTFALIRRFVAFLFYLFARWPRKMRIKHSKGAAPLTYSLPICIFSVGIARFRPVAARIWFHFVERLARNHIDEWLLTREHHQEGTL
jgi:hypothetical protein